MMGPNFYLDFDLVCTSPTPSKWSKVMHASIFWRHRVTSSLCHHHQRSSVFFLCVRHSRPTDAPNYSLLIAQAAPNLDPFFLFTISKCIKAKIIWFQEQINHIFVCFVLTNISKKDIIMLPIYFFQFFTISLHFCNRYFSINCTLYRFGPEPTKNRVQIMVYLSNLDNRNL